VLQLNVYPYIMQAVILNDHVLEKPMVNALISTQEICLNKLKCRDNTAFRALYKLYSPAIYGLILRNLGDKTKCDQVLEQTFIQAWDRIDKYDEAKCSLFTWLSRLATKVWQNSYH